MNRAKVIKDEIVEQNVRFLAVYLETKNACLVLLSEKEDKLGTLAIAVPRPMDMPGSPSSSVILGDRNAVSARMFAEHVASKKRKIALVSIYLESLNEMQAQSILRRLVDKIMSMEHAMEGSVA
ncbi:MAG: hypothetical protein N3F10_04550 [Candidatus Bathyarchaeota archaeon]|nr:hypothetical protein [Candidatus Bathyarchaeota archaeon]MCX8177552.1 hypothetical protein [Candidatus Bathyarchaeota archaeon]MDW8194358.1 hypothetical protein [Nitrososphaerota archaeon]